MQIKENFGIYFKFILIILLGSMLLITPIDAKKVHKKKKKHRSSRVVKINISQFKILKQKDFDNGLNYKELLLGNGKQWFKIHLAEIDLNSDNISVFVGKSGNNFNTLESLPSYFNNHNLNNSDSFYIAVNANFWKAYTNSPIGPTIIDGEIIENSQHKNWSSLLFDNNFKPYINNYNIKGVILYNNLQIGIDYVNRRKDSLGISYYNHYAGDTIPYVQNKILGKALDSAYSQWRQELQDMDENEDYTELQFDTTSFINNFIAIEREKQIEKYTPKILVKLIDEPAINTKYRGVITKFSKDVIECPQGSFVLSFGNNFPINMLPFVGDTLSVLFQTNEDKDIQFKNGISGTPRIARNGIAQNESAKEGNRGKRFNYSQLPRTVVGFNKDKTKFYIFTVEGTNSKVKQYGASLNDLVNIVKFLKIYNAMNLDGGGSSTFVFEGKNVMRNYDPSSSRKLSVILGVKKNINK
ncbi:MAG: phosphodiester glycosidase family protein [Candidatus Kapaibacteriota bacterium]